MRALVITDFKKLLRRVTPSSQEEADLRSLHAFELLTKLKTSIGQALRRSRKEGGTEKQRGS